MSKNFEQVYTTYFGMLNAYLFHLTRNKELTADLVQETFLRFYEKGLARGEQIISVKPWLFRTGYRLFIDHWRKERRTINMPPDFFTELQPTLSQSTEEFILESELFMQINCIFQSLDRRTQLIFWMKVVRETKYGAIGKTLNCPENTVKSIVRRTRIRMKNILQQAVGD